MDDHQPDGVLVTHIVGEAACERARQVPVVSQQVVVVLEHGDRTATEQVQPRTPRCEAHQVVSLRQPEHHPLEQLRGLGHADPPQLRALACPQVPEGGVADAPLDQVLHGVEEPGHLGIPQRRLLRDERDPEVAAGALRWLFQHLVHDLVIRQDDGVHHTILGESCPAPRRDPEGGVRADVGDQQVRALGQLDEHLVVVGVDNLAERHVHLRPVPRALMQDQGAGEVQEALVGGIRHGGRLYPSVPRSVLSANLGVPAVTISWYDEGMPAPRTSHSNLSRRWLAGLGHVPRASSVTDVWVRSLLDDGRQGGPRTVGLEPAPARSGRAWAVRPGAPVVLAALFMASPAWAATYTAGCTECDYPSLDKAIADVPSGSILDVFPGTFTLRRQILDRNLTLKAKRGAVVLRPAGSLLLDVGLSGVKVTVAMDGAFELDGGVTQEARLVSVHHGASLTLTGTKLYDVSVKGDTGVFDSHSLGVDVDGATLVANRVSFQRLSGDTRHGGAVSARNKATVSLADCTFIDNDAKLGGALSVESGSSLVVSGASTFRGGDAVQGGAIYADASTVKVTGATFSDNVVTSHGGALDLSDSPATITNSTFKANSASFGGALAATGSGGLAIGGSTFERNTARKRGGHLYLNEAAAATVASTVLREGEAYEGGSVAALHTGLTLASVKQYDNEARTGGHVFAWGKAGARSSLVFRKAMSGVRGVISGGGIPDPGKPSSFELGGGIYGQFLDLSLSHTDVSGVSAWAGGGVYVEDSTVAVSRTMFLRNEAVGDVTSGVGGALAAVRSVGAVSVHDCTLSHNDAGGSGGAVATLGGGPADIRRSTLNSNAAGALGGALFARDHLLLVHIRDAHLTLNEAQLGGGAVAVQRSPVWVLGDLKTTTFVDNAVVGASGGSAHGLPGTALGGRGGGALWIRDRRSRPSNSTITNATFSENSATDHGGALLVDGQSALTVRDVTLDTNLSGAHGGGAYLHGVDVVKADNVVLDDNDAAGDGGGMAVRGADSLTSVGLDLIANHAGGDGGGLWMRGPGAGRLTLDGEQSWVANEANELGGAVYVERIDGVSVPGGSLDASKNTANEGGGALAAVGVVSELALDGGHLHQNAAGEGAALYVDGGAAVELGALDLEANTASEAGGAVWARDVAVRVSGATVRSNKAGRGAGIDVLGGGGVELIGVKLHGNDASAAGGGVHVDGAELSVDDGTRIERNTAAAYGGGVAIEDARADLLGTHLVENRAGHGGAVAVRGGSLSLKQTSFASNSGVLSGGAVYAEEGAQLAARECTFQGNAAARGGAVRAVKAGSVSVAESTFDANRAAADVDAVGGALSVDGLSELTVEDSVFLGDEAPDGGAAVHAVDAADVRMVRNVVCGARSETGRAVELRGGEGEAWLSNNVFDGRGSALGRLLSVQDRLADIVHNHLIGSQDTGIHLASWEGSISDNLLLDHTADAAMVVPAGTPASSMAYNAFFATGPTVDGRDLASLPGVVLDPPRLAAWPVPPSEPCPTPRYHPRPDSPLIGAGSSTWPDLGPDGRPREDGHSTIGAFGGPLADPSLFEDKDGDGVPSMLDCDDLDATQTDGAFLWPDRDEDGLGDRRMPPSYECSGQPGWVDNPDDCDDDDPTLGAGQDLWPDRDGDGLGDRYADPGYACVRPGWVANDLDCDDEASHVGAAVPTWPDVDQDGFGDATAESRTTCEVDEGYVRNAMDCDDTDAERITRCAVAWYGTGCDTAATMAWLPWMLVMLGLFRRRERAARPSEPG